MASPAMAKGRLLLILVVSVVVYFGLAILGAGGFAAIFSHAPLIALVVVGVALTVVAFFSPGNLSAGEREDRGNRWVLIAFALIGFLSAWLPAFSDRIGFWTFGGDAVRWLGVILSGPGGGVRLFPGCGSWGR